MLARNLHLAEALGVIIHTEGGYGPKRRLYMRLGSLPLPALDLPIYLLAALIVVWMAPVWGSRVLDLLRDLDDYRSSRRQ